MAVAPGADGETQALLTVMAQARHQAEAGDLTGARSALEQALDRGEQRLGHDHPQLAPLMVDLATIAKELGNVTEAQRQLRRAYEINTRAHGPADRTTLAVQGRLAALTDRLGDTTSVHDRHLLETGSYVLGSDHAAVRGARARLAEKAAARAARDESLPRTPAPQSPPTAARDLDEPDLAESGTPERQDPADLAEPDDPHDPEEQEDQEAWESEPYRWAAFERRVAAVRPLSAPPPWPPPQPDLHPQSPLPLDHEYDREPDLTDWPAVALAEPSALDSAPARGSARVYAATDHPGVLERHEEPGHDGYLGPDAEPDQSEDEEYPDQREPADPAPSSAPSPPRGRARPPQGPPVALVVTVVVGVMLVLGAMAGLYLVNLVDDRTQLAAPPSTPSIPPPTAAPGAPSTGAIPTPSLTANTATAASAAPPTRVVLRDNGGSVTLTWHDPTKGTVPFIVAGGRSGVEPVALQTVAAGHTRSTIYGLNTHYDYCFTVTAVYSTEVVASSMRMCTHRLTTGSSA